MKRRAPTGVIVIASVCLLIAAAAALAAIVAAIAPGVLRPFDFPSGTSQRVFLALTFTVAAVVFGAAGYDLLRLGEFGRRAVVILLMRPSAAASTFFWIADTWQSISLCSLSQ